MKKQLLTHPFFARLEVDGQIIARIDAQVDGQWRRTHYSTGVNELGTKEHAIEWMSALSLAVALS